MNAQEEADWRARVRAEYGPGADDLTPDEEIAYAREKRDQETARRRAEREQRSR